MIAKLIGKILIKGKIHCVTGLRIGGNKSSLEIGGVDLNIIKTANGIPYIPGSSLKGKLRSLLAKIDGSEKPENDPERIQSVFGKAGNNDKKEDGKNNKTRLLVRDAMLITNEFPYQNKENGEFMFSEIKTENRVERSTGSAKDPRNIERVPAGAIFDMDIVFDIYETDDADSFISLLIQSLELLRLDYLGGHGSRGSGKVDIEITHTDVKQFNTVFNTNLKSINELSATFPPKIKEQPVQ